MRRPILKRVGHYQAVRRMRDREFRLKFKTEHMEGVMAQIEPYDIMEPYIHEGEEVHPTFDVYVDDQYHRVEVERSGASYTSAHHKSNSSNTPSVCRAGSRSDTWRGQRDSRCRPHARHNHTL